MACWSAEEKMNYEVIHAPDGQKNVLYKALRMCFKALNLKKLLIGTKEEVLARAAKMNARNPFVLPADKKAHYTDHLILEKYHCLEIDTEDQRREKPERIRLRLLTWNIFCEPW